MSTHGVRDARPEDAPALARLMEVLEFGAPEAVVVERLAEVTGRGERVIVAETEGRVIGFAVVHVMPVLHRPHPVGRVSTIAVLPEHQGRGAGRALLAEAEHIARAAGCGLMEVTSNLRLAGAHAFYERLGFEKTSWRLGKRLT